MPINVNQWKAIQSIEHEHVDRPSDICSGSQLGSQSERPLRDHSEITPRPSAYMSAINGNQGQSMAIKGPPRTCPQSRAIEGNQWQSMALRVHVRNRLLRTMHQLLPQPHDGHVSLPLEWVRRQLIIDRPGRLDGRLLATARRFGALVLCLCYTPCGPDGARMTLAGCVAPHLMKEAHNGTQRHPEALSGTQRHSVALRGTQRLRRGYAEARRGHQ